MFWSLTAVVVLSPPPWPPAVESVASLYPCPDCRATLVGPPRPRPAQRLSADGGGYQPCAGLGSPLQSFPLRVLILLSSNPQRGGSSLVLPWSPGVALAGLAEESTAPGPVLGARAAFAPYSGTEVS